MNAAKRWHYVFAALAFGIPLWIFAKTVTPTVPFWDSGEFIATSKILGLPHPPGNPIYTMLGRMMTFLPIKTIAWRVNIMSSLCSAIACLFTFLFTTRALRRTFAGRPGLVPFLACELGGLIAAILVAGGGSFWDSAIEAEVYSLSSAMLAIMVWLAFNWWDHVGEPGNDKLLVLIMYLVGLSTGAHLGTVLIAPPLVVLFAIVKPELFLNRKFMIPFLFFLAFIITAYMNQALEMVDLPGSFFLTWLAIGAVIGIWHHRFFIRKNLVAWWVLAGVIGVTCQVFLLVRSQQLPSINEGAPNTLHSWLEYLGRKQYGPSDPFQRRAEVWYQIQHMYLRYVGQQWHLIERMGQLDLSSFWVVAVNAVPFLLFFLGAWWNYKQDRKTFWFFFAVHVIMGPALIFYLNFTDHEVRERDYFFTNSYHFMAVWMGMGAAAVFDYLARALTGETVVPAPAAAARAPSARAGIVNEAPAALPGPLALEEPSLGSLPGPASARAGIILGGVALLGLSFLPVRDNWYEHDRSGFYIAHDYAYNMLVPLAPGAIVFTNGDNDTFPLWYIQEVENVRRDVRVVNLSLLNTAWYIKQLRDQVPHVPFSYTDAQLDALQPYQDPQTGKVVWVKDLAVQDIVKTNQWKRPLYLAVTVPDQMGFEKKLTLEGLVFRMYPEDTKQQLDVNKTLYNLYHVFQYRGLLDKNRAYDTSVYKDENAYRLVQNYTAAHVQVAYQLQLDGKPKEAIRVLEDAIKISPDFPGLIEYLGRLYEDTGNLPRAEQLYVEGVRRFPTAPEFHYHLGVVMYQSGRVDLGIAELRRAAELNQQYFDWFSALFTALWQTGRKAEAVDVLRTWARAHPEDREGAGYLRQYEESLRILSAKPPAQGGTH